MSDTADESYRRRVVEIFDGVDYGPKQVLTLSDTEILALDDPKKQRVTPLLSLQGLSGDRLNDTAKAAAERLFEAGHAEDGTPLGGPGSEDEPTVRTVLRMRRSWLCLLVIDQNSALGRDFISMYLRADGRALTELASHNGQHTFTVMKRAVALDSALQLLTPFAEVDSDDADGDAYPIGTWQDRAADTLAQAKVVSTVSSRRQNRAMDRRVEDRFAVYNFDERTEILFTESADRVRIAPIARPTLR
ncbi:MAG: hypothetical protein ACRDO7_18485, partial [Nocardioidaceae bacterium]